MIDFLKQDSAIVTAARVGKVLGIDPVVVLSDAGDPFLTDVRIACASVIQDDEKRQEEEQRRSQRSGGAGRRPRGRRR